MSKVWNLRTDMARSVAAVVMIAGLAACGGGSSTGASTNPSANQNNAGNGTSNPSTNASFFDSVFLDGSGAGYYEFEGFIPSGSATMRPTSTGMTRFFVTGDTDPNFSMSSTGILGTFAPYVDMGYLTQEGLFLSNNPFPSDIGSNSHIFARLAQGYQLGIGGMSTPLYEITLTVQDVSGMPANEVSRREESVGNGLPALLRTDTTPMPAGAQTYTQVAHILVQHVAFNATAVTRNATSLEQLQTGLGGTIQTLGGYRYLMQSGTQSVYVEYNGTIHNGWLYNAGDTRDAMSQGSNRIAANFLAQEEQKAGL